MSTSWLTCPACNLCFPGNGSAGKPHAQCPDCSRNIDLPLGPEDQPRWYFAREKKKQGPFTLIEIRALVAEGQLKTTDMVWQSGGQQWLPTASILGLLPQGERAEAAFETAQSSQNRTQITTPFANTADQEARRPSWRWIVGGIGVTIVVLAAICVVGVFALYLWRQCQNPSDQVTGIIYQDKIDLIQVDEEKGAVNQQEIDPPPEMPTKGPLLVSEPIRPVIQPAQGNRPQLVAQLGHSEGINAVAFSPNGRLVVTGGLDNTAHLWDTATSIEIRLFGGHTAPIFSCAFSPDGKSVVTGSSDRTARLWDVENGKEIHRFEGHAYQVDCVDFSPDGRSVLTGSLDSTVRLWDVGTGKEIRCLKASSVVYTVAFSPDGQLILTGCDDSTACLWDAATGKEIRRLKGHTGRVYSVAFSRTGQTALTGCTDGSIRLWDVATGTEIRHFSGGFFGSAKFFSDGLSILTLNGNNTVLLLDVKTGKEIRRFQGHTDLIRSVACSSNRQFVLTGSWDGTACLWDASTGKQLHAFQGISAPIFSSTFSTDGRFVLTGGGDNTARLWNAVTGSVIRCFKGHTDSIYTIAFTEDARSVITVSRDKTIRHWNIETGKEERRIKLNTSGISSAALSPNRRLVATKHEDHSPRLWDVSTGKEIQGLDGSTSLAFSPDGQTVLTGGKDNAARLRTVTTGKEVCCFKGHSDKVKFGTFSPDGLLAVTGSYDGTARLWDVVTGNEIRRFDEDGKKISSAVISPDQRSLLTGSDDESARLWDMTTGKEICCFRGHSSKITTVAFSPDGRSVLTGSWDRTARLWDVTTGREMCRLLTFQDGTWAVTDSDGRFDASNGGNIQGLNWVVGSEPIALDQLKERFYDPGLLAKKLGFSKEALRQVDTLTTPKLYPNISISSPTANNSKLGIMLTNRGGGIGRVVVKINGKELTADARAPRQDPNVQTLRLNVELVDDPRLRTGEKNVIEVQVFNGEGYLRSRGLQILYEPAGKPQIEPPEVWAVVVGISKYHGGRIDLRYAAKDAEDFATALQIASGRLFGSENIRLNLLTTTQSDEANQPTRENIIRALTVTQKAKPQDIVILYMAGHGVNHGGQDGDFYFLTREAQSADLSDPAVRAQVSLSSQQLTELIKQIPAQKQVLVLDTCAAGRAVEKLVEKRDVPSSQVRALERVKDRTGLHILAGCAADAVSYEATRYGQGMLTHSLLLGMRGAKLRDGQFVDVTELFSFAADKVPELAKDIGGIQRPVIASPKGSSFDIGQVTAEDQKRIPLQTIRPLVLRPNFQEEKQVKDVLALNHLVCERLRDVSARGPQAKLVFVDAGALPDAYELVGRYRIEGDRVSITVTMFYGDKDTGQFTVIGVKTRLEEFAANIVDEAEKRLGLQNP